MLCLIFVFLKKKKFREPEPGDDLRNYCAQGIAWGNDLNSQSLQCTRSFGDYKYKIARMGLKNFTELVGLPSQDVEHIRQCVYSLISGVPAIRSQDGIVSGYLLIGSDGFWDAFEDRQVLANKLAKLRDSGYTAEGMCAALTSDARVLIPATESKVSALLLSVGWGKC